MKIITERSSETGRKFEAIEKRCKECFDEQKAMAKKYGFTQWRRGFWCIAGRLSSVIFPDPGRVDTKVWRNVNGSKSEWMPKRNSKEGKEIQAEFDKMNKVSGDDLNDCIDFDGTFRNIGVNFGHPKYIGISAEDEWEIRIPNDCREVTNTEYYRLFPKKEVEEESE